MPPVWAEGSKPRDGSIDWMRAASILYIVGFWHLHNYTTFVPWYPNPPFAHLTVTALALFVLISGFLAGKPAPLSAARIGGYYKRRLIRIYPPYLAALIVFTVLGLSGAAFVPSALMLNMIVPPPPYTLWFMTMVVLFYIAAPFLLALAQVPARLIGSLAAAWLLLFLIDRFVFDIEDRLLIYLPAFCAGILLAHARLPKRSSLLVCSAVLAAAGWWVSLNAPPRDPDLSLWMALWATPSAVFSFVLLQGRLPSSRIVAQLSSGGFFLYLFHRPIFVIVLKLSGAETPGARELVLLAVAFPAAIIFGIVAQRGYDALVGWRWPRPWRKASVA